MSTEQQLRDLFHTDAAAAPEAEHLLDGALAKVRHRRRTRVGLFSLAGITATIALVLVVTGAFDSIKMPPFTAAPAPSIGNVPSGRAGQPVPGNAAASCVYDYSPAAIAAHADFAFDGTVTAIGPARSNRGDAGDLTGLAGVTLHVNQWFKGGSAESVVVDMPTPANATTGEDSGGAPGYGLGTRLLVSGAARWGGTDPLKSAIAWWGCGGFTRYYSSALATSWASANPAG
jgi:hypothetical protein